MKEREIIYIPAEKKSNISDLYRIKNVCAYCRVSSLSDEQFGSLKTQINYYTDLIESNFEWKNAGIYSEQCSGKSIKNRIEYNKLIRKCRNGKVDIILTKSISRFSRNTVDLIETCRELKSRNIDVWFENENIKLLSLDSMFILETYAAFAEEENRIKSKNIKWGVRAGFENGNSGYANFSCYGYTNTSKGLGIHKEEAEVVKLIFKLRLDGKSLGKISNELEKRKILSPTGKDKWSRETINKLLKNEKYTGSVLLQKTFVENYIDGKQKKNNGEVQQVLIKGNHKKIISVKIFEEINK